MEEQVRGGQNRITLVALAGYLEEQLGPSFLMALVLIIQASVLLFHR